MNCSLVSQDDSFTSCHNLFIHTWQVCSSIAHHPLFSSNSFDSISICSFSHCFELQCFIRFDDRGLNNTNFLNFFSWNISAWPFKKKLFTCNSFLMSLFIDKSPNNFQSDGRQRWNNSQSFGSHSNFFSRIQRKRILFKPNFSLSMLQHNLIQSILDRFTILIPFDWIPDNTEMSGWDNDHLGRCDHNLLIVLPDEGLRSPFDPCNIGGLVQDMDVVVRLDPEHRCLGIASVWSILIPTHLLTKCLFKSEFGLLKTIDFVSQCKYGENRYDKNVDKTFFGFQGSLNFTQQT